GYRFNIFARNITGLSIASIDISATPFTVPNQITAVVAIPRDRQVDLSWNAPFNGGRDISNYLIKVYTDLSNWDISANTTDTSYNITGLINGTGYRFNISARNIAGLSIASTDISASPFTVPSAPIITAIAGNSLVDLSWNAPFNGTRDITSYIIEKSTDLSSWNIDSSTNASTQFKRVSYLSNATLFYFRVYARNLGGNGSSSNVVNVIPFTVPSAPIITATAGNRFIQLSWDAPNNNGRDNA
ncbi:MAG: fibronectin type III domain-containing protein, partial [Actinobacteria bacterium]|nr:fibronectin type III domain-containing protein [Actinomycetota bacterium]